MSVEKIEVEATYERGKDIPILGSSKFMRVNGRRQKMFCVSVEAEREHAWADNGYSHIWWYRSSEVWAEYLYGV